MDRKWGISIIATAGVADMKHSIIAVMVVALLGFHLGEGVNEDWFAEYGMERDVVDEIRLEVLAEEGDGEGGY